MITEHFSGKTAVKFQRFSNLIFVEKEGIKSSVSIQEFEKMTGALFIPELDFDHFSTLSDLAKKTGKLHRKGELTQEQLWNGSYYKKEIQSFFFPDVTLKWIQDDIGFGLFANRPFKKGQFITEYAGKVRKKKRDDAKNAYCFEYVIAPHIPTSYVIDAQDQGGFGRLINHSDKPNLRTALATIDSINHVILIAIEPIAIGDQLLYDYGIDYWNYRSKKPKSFI